MAQELKAYDAYIMEVDFHPDDATVKLDAIVSSNSSKAENDWSGEAACFACYKKDEVDAEIAELKKACNDKDDWCVYTLKENRHHKYKRCLAMALLWLDRSENSTDLENELVSRRRYGIWLELAKKFKEAK